MTAAIEHRQLTVSEAAAAFGVPRRTLYRWIDRRGLMPETTATDNRTRGRVPQLYRLRDLADVVADNREPTRRETDIHQIEPTSPDHMAQ